jgi:hypothetical protein
MHVNHGMAFLCSYIIDLVQTRCYQKHLLKWKSECAAWPYQQYSISSRQYLTSYQQYPTSPRQNLMSSKLCPTDVRLLNR